MANPNLNFEVESRSCLFQRYEYWRFFSILNFNKSFQLGFILSSPLCELYFPGAWSDLVGLLQLQTAPIKMWWLDMIGCSAYRVTIWLVRVCHFTREYMVASFPDPTRHWMDWERDEANTSAACKSLSMRSSAGLQYKYSSTSNVCVIALQQE